jgi:hypothetical protein
MLWPLPFCQTKESQRFCSCLSSSQSARSFRSGFCFSFCHSLWESASPTHQGRELERAAMHRTLSTRATPLIRWVKQNQNPHTRNPKPNQQQRPPTIDPRLILLQAHPTPTFPLEILTEPRWCLLNNHAVNSPSAQRPRKAPRRPHSSHAPSPCAQRPSANGATYTSLGQRPR